MSNTFLTDKIFTGENILRASTARIEWIFETFPSVCLSFSGGKDSTVLFHLVAEVARRRKRHFSVLFIDWEA
ncbi:TPA: phosphoadenosine phosphosulfate reductase family protein, partial [Escherichia coli]|nr:phosphoadenosine phosphosulfate sulfotransferase [Escherichia coli]HAY0396478.1 phosphoadenosine phosphosulfate reductase family protein [Escherichia coli]